MSNEGQGQLGDTLHYLCKNTEYVTSWIISTHSTRYFSSCADDDWSKSDNADNTKLRLWMVHIDVDVTQSNPTTQQSPVALCDSHPFHWMHVVTEHFDRATAAVKQSDPKNWSTLPGN